MYIYIYYGILFIGVIVGISKIPILNRSNKAFLLLLLITFIHEIFSYFLREYKLQKNFLHSHIFHPIQFILIGYAYFQELRYPLIKRIIPIMVLLALVLTLFVQPISQYDTYFINIELLIFSFFCILYFRKLLLIRTEYALFSFSLFWISCGLLLFCVSNLFYFGTFNTFFNEKNDWQIVFMYVRLFTNYILYTMLIIAFSVKQHTLNDNER